MSLRPLLFAAIVFISILVTCKAGGVPITFVRDAVKEGAVCLDGSPPALYFRPGTGSGVNKWNVYHKGGGWCGSAADCAARALTALGSSTRYPKEQPMTGTYLAADPKVNPLMYNWNTVYLAYCDGSSFSSNAAEPLKVGNQTIYYRGSRVLNALKNYLLTKNLGNATDFVISGSSAGALAVYHHADFWTQGLTSLQKAVGLPDCGFFLDWPKPSSKYNDCMNYIFKMNPVIHPGCAKGKSGAQLEQCLFAEHLVPFVKTPLFAMQARFDAWQIAHEIGSKQPQAVNPYGNRLVNRVNSTLLAAPKNAVFLDSCTHHTGAYDSIQIQGLTAAHALDRWYNGAIHQKFWFQDKVYPCPSCCHNV